MSCFCPLQKHISFARNGLRTMSMIYYWCRVYVIQSKCYLHSVLTISKWSQNNNTAWTDMKSFNHNFQLKNVTISVYIIFYFYSSIGFIQFADQRRWRWWECIYSIFNSKWYHVDSVKHITLDSINNK